MYYHNVTLKIPDGFQILEHKSTVDIDTACAILSTKKQNKYTEADREGLSATLVWHSVRCPYCGSETLAYFDDQNRKKVATRVPKSEVEEWSSRQMSLFEEQNKTLSLNSVYFPTDQYTCPKCQSKLKKSQHIRRVRFCESKNKLIISCELTTPAELFSITWFAVGKIRFDTEIYETLTFNFKNGHTYIKLENAEGEIFAIRDITTDITQWNDGIIYLLFSKSKTFRRTLKRFFLSKYNGELPFSVCELSLEKYVILTRFVGYGRSFYDAIPFGEEKPKIHSSFSAIAKKLHSAEKIPEIYERIGLPKMKSVRKLIFTNPGMMFYANEIKELWNILHNPDLLCSLLNSQEAYHILSDLHMYKGIYPFYRDYIKVKGAISLCRLVRDKISYIHSYAAFYSSMNDNQKKCEQKKWSKKDAFISMGKRTMYYNSMLRLGESFSIPMHAVDERIFNCVIDGFSFVWLRNMMEYKHAGKILVNCLGVWRSWDNPVVVVYQKQNVLAAIEVEGTTIKQAQLANHRNISENEDLSRAYDKWKERFNLEFQPYIWEDFDGIDDDIDDDLDEEFYEEEFPF